ncbi:lipopolysaccharide assembly protein LapB [Malonomonas rubra]|uniref:tetratricopeptide repeat protein n=1 Tax=Malonomonas rubra TaxID=57040 RepID=UPI0026EC75D6|nr:tetratricopeptide repeat protein [Malonomonas rubra]
MARFVALLTVLLLTASPATSASTPQNLRDLYFGEALYYAFQGEWFDAVARLDTELAQYRRLDQPQLDTLYYHIGQAKFAVGDFELAYRMHHRAGRAISAVIEGNVAEEVRNEGLYRLARIYFQKDQPVNALLALERIEGTVPEDVKDDLSFLRGQVLMVNGRYGEATAIFRELQKTERLQGFSDYNLGIALIRDGQELAGLKSLEQTGQLNTENPEVLAIKDKANLMLGGKLLETENFTAAALALDRVRLDGPFSNRALLSAGWAEASRQNFERALVPWSLLAEREVTDDAVQEALLSVPYAYGKLGVFSKAANLYSQALQAYGAEIDKLSISIKSIREGKFLLALKQEELQEDADWVVKLRELPDSPETFYLLELLASHDFQLSLQNYLDLEQLGKKLRSWRGDLAVFEELIVTRRGYYAPLLPEIDQSFRELDAQMRLRLEQKDRVAQRLQTMLVVPRPDYLATGAERVSLERLDRLEQKLSEDVGLPSPSQARIDRLQGTLLWNIHTDYDRRLTETYKHLQTLNGEIEKLRQQYTAFVRTRQAATQSYQGYDQLIIRLRTRIDTAAEKVASLAARQGHLLETMAVDELISRRERLAEYQVKARFAMADSYDRAVRAEGEKRVEQ